MLLQITINRTIRSQEREPTQTQGEKTTYTQKGPDPGIKPMSMLGDVKANLMLAIISYNCNGKNEAKSALMILADSLL